jgi:hypothetical protein
MSQKMTIIFGARALHHFPFLTCSKHGSKYILATAIPGSTSLLYEQS